MNQRGLWVTRRFTDRHTHSNTRRPDKLQTAVWKNHIPGSNLPPCFQCTSLWIVHSATCPVWELSCPQIDCLLIGLSACLPVTRKPTSTLFLFFSWTYNSIDMGLWHKMGIPLHWLAVASTLSWWLQKYTLTGESLSCVYLCLFCRPTYLYYTLYKI